MGCFSWRFADDCRRRLKIGSAGYLLQPNGNNIFESSYDGYGVFGGIDVYEAVVDWNRSLLSKEMLKETPVREHWGDNAEGALDYARACKRYQYVLARMDDWRSTRYSSRQMEDKYGKDWKREIGIDIACYEEQNQKLQFPIKIASHDVPYESVMASLEDPSQGL